MNRTQRRAKWHNLRVSIKRRDSYKCVCCGSLKNLTIDHIKPVSKGGANEPENLQTLCHSCNGRKSDRIISLQELRAEIIDEIRNQNPI